MENQESRIESIFVRVAALDLAERDALLDELCAEPGEREEVERLLEWDSKVPEHFLEEHHSHSEAIEEGMYVGPYLVLDRLGEGGMGTVYSARQAFPDREVALKVLRVGRVTEETTRRFRQEIDVLGRLQHVGIARIYDAGSSALHDLDGQSREVPYFTMEWVRGRPLITHAREQKLPVRARVELLAMVCDAVHYAHQRGVIHRDLKSENVLVTQEESSASGESRLDGQGVIGQPKVLDFGIARVMDPQMAHGTRHTADGALIGTLASMSPEQVSGHGELVDVRTDVYSLGVMLYELLCDRAPLALDGLSVPQATTLISTAVPELPGSIDSALRGDLTTISMKALEKEPGRRYQTTLELANDLRRFLSGEPITARADSRMYLLQRSLRRHRVMFGVALAFVVLLSWLSVVTRRQAHASEVLAGSEAHAREIAEQDLHRAMGAVELLTNLADSGLRDNPGAEGTRHELLEAALDFHKGLLEDHPDAPGLRASQAGTRLRVAQLEFDIGRPSQALNNVQQCISEFEEQLAEGTAPQVNAALGLVGALTLLGSIESKSGEIAAAEQHLGDACERATAILDSLGEEETSWERAHMKFARAHKLLAVVFRSQARNEEALDILLLASQRLIPVLKEHASFALRAESIGILEQSCVIRLELKINEGLEEDLLRGIDLTEGWIASSPSGPQAQQTMLSLLSNYSFYLSAQGRVEEACERLESGLGIGEQLVEDHPALSRAREVLFLAYNNHATSLITLTDYAGAAKDLARAGELMRGLIQEDPTPYRMGRLVILENTLAALQISLGQHQDASEALDRVIDNATELLRLLPGNLEYAAALRIATVNQALCKVALGEHAEGIEMLREAGLGRSGYEAAQNVVSTLKIYRDAIWSAKRDLDLDEELRLETTQGYAESAAKYLHEARVHGFAGLAEEVQQVNWADLGEYPVFATELESR